MSSKRMLEKRNLNKPQPPEFRVNYFRCHYRLCQYLKNRCEIRGIHFKCERKDYSSFLLTDSQNNVKIKFERDATTKTFLIDNLITINNEHLLGLYCPDALFELLDKLFVMRKSTGLDICVDNNKIYIVDFQSKKDLTKTISDVLDNLENLDIPEDLRIQLDFYQKLVFNRSLSVSIDVLDVLLNKNANIIDFALCYFKCFSIAPICCRMQSLALSAIIEPREQYSSLHMQTHYLTYIEISKILFPYISSIDNNMLLKNYLEIMPVSLIRIEHPQKLLKLFCDFLELDISVKPLSDGSFSIADHFIISSKILVTLENPKELKAALNIAKFLNPTIFKKQTNFLKYDPSEYFEYKKVSVYDKGALLYSYTVDHLPQCEHNPVCSDITNIENLNVFYLAKYPFLTIDDQDWQRFTDDEISKFYDFIISTWQCFNPRHKPIPFLTDLNAIFSQDENPLEYLSTTLSPNVALAFMNLSYCYRQTFTISNRMFISFENIENENFVIAHHYFFEKLKEFEISEGICFTYVNKILETVEFMNYNLLNLDKEGRLIFDKFYTTDTDLAKFFEIIAKENFSNLPFMITEKGFIMFGDYLKIRPCTLLKVKNVMSFLNIIKEFCDTFSKGKNVEYDLEELEDKAKLYGKNENYNVKKEMYEDKLKRATFRSWWSILTCKEDEMVIEKYKRSVPWETCNNKELFIQLAKLINPRLKNLDKNMFYLKNFLCVPMEIFASQNKEKYLKLFEMLHKNRINFYLREDGGFKIILNYMVQTYTKFLKNPIPLLEYLAVLEECIADFQYSGIVCDNIFRFTTAIFDTEKLSTTETNQMLLLECLSKLEKSDPLPSAAILLNGMLKINSGITISPKAFLKFSEHQQKNFFKAATLSHTIHERGSPDHWINIVNEKNEKVKPYEGAKGFCLVDTNTDIYLKIAKFLQPNLHCFQDDELMKYRCLKLLSKNFVVENPNKVWEILQALKNCDVEVIPDIYGYYVLENIKLTTSQLIDIRDLQEICTTIVLMNNFNERNIRRYHCIYPTGLITDSRYPLEVEESFANPMAGLLALQKFYDSAKEYYFFTFILNSMGYLMIGNYIWINLNEYFKYLPDFYAISAHYDQAWNTQKPELMKSIHNLSNIENGIILAKKMNKLLYHLSDEFIQSKNLKVFPVDLYEKWLTNPAETFTIVMKKFEQLENSNITWDFMLNGYLCLQHRLVITLTQLEKIVNFDELLKLLQILSPKFPLLCEEEVINGKFKESRIYLSTLPSYRDIEKAKFEADNYCKLGNKIESNGTLLFNKNIWIQPKEFLVNKEKIIEINEILLKIFDKNEVVDRFQYGKWKTSVVTSPFRTPNEIIHDYSQIFCSFVEEYDNTISIKYYAKRKQFKFNHCILIHPRSFFHLQNIRNFVNALKKYSLSKADNRDKEFLADLAKAQPDQKKTNENLWAIQKAERIEFMPIRNFCFLEIGKLLKKNEKVIKNFLPSLEITENASDFYNVKTVTVQDELIFKKGVANALVVVGEKNEWKFAYSEDIFLTALQTAVNLDEKIKCKNLFDFQSLLESIKEYSDGKVIKNNKMQKSKKLEGKLFDEENYQIWWNTFIHEISKVEACQNKFQKKFSNVLKGLHHWYKHGQDHDNLEDYYQKMNEFFDTCRNVERELLTQDGMKVLYNYKNSEYHGGLVIEESTNKLLVTTFFKIKKDKAMKFKSFNANASTEFLVITDMSFPLSEEQIELDNKIMVMTFKNISSIKRLPNGLNNIIKILCILPKTLAGENKTEIMKSIILETKNKFKNDKFQLLIYCPSASDDKEIINAEEINFDNVEIITKQVANNEVTEWKKFIESNLLL